MTLDRRYRAVHAERLADMRATRLARQTRAFRLAPDTGHAHGHTYRVKP